MYVCKVEYLNMDKIPYDLEIGKRMIKNSMAKEWQSNEEFICRFINMEDTLTQLTKMMEMLQGKLAQHRNQELKILMRYEI